MRFGSLHFVLRFACVAIAASLLLTSGVSAAVGDLLATVDVPIVSPFGVAISGTFDGTNYMYTNVCANFPNCAPNDVIIATPPAGNGTAALVATKPFFDTAGSPLFITAISWDASRGKLWGATAIDNPIKVYLFDISGANAVGTFQFINTQGGIDQVDGLAWDANDDTLYLSPDIDCNVYQYSLGTGPNPALGTLMNTVSPQNAAGNVDCAVSGVAIGAGNSLYIGRNGNNEIRRVNKSSGVFISTFATTQGRVEDLVCDPVTYAPLEAILAKDSNADLYEAFEVETGTCPLAGEECDPDPRTQGYWNRQCLGAGLITPGRNGRGPQEPLEPGFDKLEGDVSLVLQNQVFEFEACADGIDAVPPSDPCERAKKQYTALLFNLESGRLQDGCGVDLSAAGCTSTNIGDLVDELAGLINSGECNQAATCAGAVNEGDALESVSVASTTEPSTAPVTTTLSGSSLGGATVPDAVEIAEPTAEAVSSPVASIPMVLSVGSDVVEQPSSDQEAVVEEEEEEDPLQTIERHLMILTDGSSLQENLEASTDALLTALSGGYELETRLAVAKALLGRIDVSLHSLLAAHLEDIRSEAEAFDKLDLALEATRLLKGLEPGE